MLLIVGSAFDGEPWALAQRWAHRDVAVVTPRELSRPGWRLRLGRPGETRAAIGDRMIPAGEIDAVVSLLSWVGPFELPHIVEADREYVASEMTAFLLAWLSELSCPVLDRPSPLSLAGCGRWPAEWAAVAEGVGTRADVAWAGETVEVTVVGGRAIADGTGRDGPLRAAAEAVAAAAGRSLVTLSFSPGTNEPVLVGALARPASSSASGAAALLSWIDGQSA